jgi:uncharacterized membrane protein
MIPIGFFIIGFGLLLIISRKYIKDSSINRYIDLYLWIKIIFVLFTLSIGICSISNLTGQNLFFPLGVLSSLWMYFAFTFVLLHSALTLGNKKTALFFALTLFLGFFSEFLGVKYGLFFGHYYYYNLSPFFFDAVPLMTPISWAIIIYMCYGVTNFILHCAGGEKPNLRDNWLRIFIMIIVLSSVDGLCAMNLDMIIDPIAVLPSVTAWVWIGGGPYFDVPISNFIGWFMVVFGATFIFRLYESRSKKTKIQEKEEYKFGFLLPAIYFLYFLEQTTFAFNHGTHIEIVLIGAATMFPFILIAILLFLSKYYGGNNENK